MLFRKPTFQTYTPKYRIVSNRRVMNFPLNDEFTIQEMQIKTRKEGLSLTFHCNTFFELSDPSGDRECYYIEKQMVMEEVLAELGLIIKQGEE